jgi:hypothetical protein
MSLTLGNPLGGTSAGAVTRNQFDIKNAGKSLSTGLKANNDVVSDFIGKSLSDKQFILSKINTNMAYSKNAMSVAATTLSNMAKTLADMLATIAQATGNSETNLASLNDIFIRKMEQLDAQRTAAVFDGRKLLTGDLGQDATIRSNFARSALSVKSMPTTTANLFLDNTGAAGFNNIKISKTITAGDNVTIGGVTFKAIAAGSKPANENEFSLASTRNEIASNLATAIQKHSSESLQGYTTAANAINVVVTQVAKSATPINVTSSANIKSTYTPAAGTTGIDLGGIRDTTGFVGAVKPVFTRIEFGGANGAGYNLARKYKNELALATAASHANNRAAAYSTVIGGRTFTGALFYTHGAANLNSKQLKMTCDATNESFIVTTGATFNNTVANLNNAAAADNVIAPLNNLFAGTTFNETKTLKINTNKGDIIDDTGTAVASTKGTVVKLQAADFNQLSFKDFKIEQATGNGFKFTAVIEGKDPKNPQTYTVDNIDQSTLVQGFKLDLIDSTSGNVLSINLGERGLTSLKPTNMNAIASAYKDTMINAGDGLKVRIGLDFGDVLNVNFGNVSNDKLFVNNKGEYIKNLSIKDPANANIAQEVLTNALRITRSEEQKVKSQIESVQEASEALTRNIQVTKEASEGYLNTDLIEAAQIFSEAVKKMIAAISSLEAGNKVSDAAQRVIQSIA